MSLLFSEEVLKSTPPRPILGAGAVDAAVEVPSKEPNVSPPPAPRVVCPKPGTQRYKLDKSKQIKLNGYVDITTSLVKIFVSPVDTELLNKLPPSDGTVEAAVEAVEPPRPREKVVAAACCGAVEVRIEPNDKPVPTVEEAVLVVSENGDAEAVGLLKAKLKPVVAAVEAGAPPATRHT